MKPYLSDLQDLAAWLQKIVNVANAKAEQHEHSSEKGAAEYQRNRSAKATVYRDAVLLAVKTISKRTAPLDEAEKKASEAVAKLFARRSDTQWSEGELKSFRKLFKAGNLTPENITALELYYACERRKGQDGHHRRDLGTFLNNFTGELDRARAFKASPPKGDPRKQVIAPDPSRWKRYCTERGFPATPFDGAPQHWKDGFTKWEQENGF